MKIKTIAAAGAVGLGMGFAGFISAATASAGPMRFPVRTLRQVTSTTTARTIQCWNRT